MYGTSSRVQGTTKIDIACVRVVESSVVTVVLSVRRTVFFCITKNTVRIHSVV